MNIYEKLIKKIALLKLDKDYYKDKSKNILRDEKYERMINYLCRDTYQQTFINFVKSINTYSKRQQDYIIETLEKSNKYNLGGYHVLKIIESKLEILKVTNENDQLPELDKLYYCLHEKNEKLYSRLVSDYKNFSRKGTMEKINAIIDNEKSVEFFDLLPRDYLYELAYLNGKRIDELLKNDSPIAMKREFLEVISAEKEYYSIKLNGIEDEQYKNLLNFIFSGNKESTVFFKTKLIAYLITRTDNGNLEYKENAVNRLEEIPDALIEAIVHNNLDNEKMHKIIDNLNVNDNKELDELIKNIKETTDENLPILIKALANNQTIKVFENINKINLVLKSLNSENKNNYKEKIELLFGKEKYSDAGFYYQESGYLFSILMNKNNTIHLISTLEFIGKDDDIEILTEKINLLRKIEEQVLNGIPDIEYDWYLKLIDNSLKGKTKKEKVKYLQVHSNYFQNHKIENILNNMCIGDNLNTFQNLFNENQKKGQMNQNLKFIEIADKYDEEIIKIVADELLNSPSKKISKSIVNCITSYGFLKLDKESQKEMLYKYLGKTYNSEDKAIVFDSSKLKNQIESAGGEMIFVNEETGFKIKVMTKNNNPQKKD